MAVAYNFVNILFMALMAALFARAILSWFGVGPGSRIGTILYELTEPLLAPLRKLIPPLGGMIDITPIIALFVLQFLRDLILSGLRGF